MKKTLTTIGIFIVVLLLGISIVFGIKGILSRPANSASSDASASGNLLNDQTQQDSDDTHADDKVDTEDIYLGPFDKGQNDPTEFAEKPKELPKEDEKEPSSDKPSKEYFLRVNRLANCVTVYEKDANGNYVPIKAMVCSVGLDGNTPLGSYKTINKYVWRALFGNVYGQYATRITGHYLFHSVPYKKAEKDTLQSEEYNNLGSAASAGCVRLSVEDAKWIYDNCGIGTKVEIYDSEDPGPLGKPEPIHLDLESKYKGWDPTDPDEKNPWKKAIPSISGVKDLTVERGSDPDLESHVTAKDYDDKKIPFTIEGTLDLNKCGSYKVTYKVVNAVRHSDSTEATITVVDTTAPVITQPTIPTVYNSTRDLKAKIMTSLSVKDAGFDLEEKYITLDITALQQAISSNSYGTYTCKVTAVDEYGNKTNVVNISVVYAQEDEAPPTITLTGTAATATVDLTNIANETDRLRLISMAAKEAVLKGTHFTVSDDITASEDITCRISCNYRGDTAAGTHILEVTIQATDEKGQKTTCTINVTIIVEDHTETPDEPDDPGNSGE